MTRYIWDVVSDNVLMETDDVGATTAVYTQEPDLYGELISQYRDGQSSYYHFDGQGSTRAVTDENQNVVEEATYSAFGEVVAKTSSIVNPFGYKGALGYYTSPGTNELYVRARAYGLTINRWLSRDPISAANSSYVYVENNPVGLVDPSGLASQNCCGPCLVPRPIGPPGVVVLWETDSKNESLEGKCPLIGKPNPFTGQPAISRSTIVSIVKKCVHDRYWDYDEVKKRIPARWRECAPFCKCLTAELPKTAVFFMDDSVNDLSCSFYWRRSLFGPIEIVDPDAPRAQECTIKIKTANVAIPALVVKGRCVPPIELDDRDVLV